MPRTRAGLPAEAARLLDELPERLRSHIERVREIAGELAGVHGADRVAVDMGAACHDLFRAESGERLLALAEEYGICVCGVEQALPMMLHGPVAAAWLARCAGMEDADVLEAVRWHTTGHPGLGLVGGIVFLADKLDPVKKRKYPFQDELRELAMANLDGALLMFVTRQAEAHLGRGRLVHPRTMEFRNSLLLRRQSSGVSRRAATPVRGELVEP